MSSESKRPGIQRMPFAGVWTRRAIWLDDDMSHTEKALLAQIESLDKLKFGCIATNDYFAEFFQLSPRQIKRYIARLIKLGWIVAERKGWNRRRLRPTPKLKALKDKSDAFEGHKSPSTEGQERPPTSTEKNNSERIYRTQPTARPYRHEPGPHSTLNRAAIPAALKSLKQWVVWRWEERRGNWDKPPYQPNGRPAKTNNPATWVSFEAAVEAFESGRFDGVGFVLNADDPFAMVDLDNCLDSACGNIEAWARDIVDQLRSYTEITPSGVGLRVIVKAMLPLGGRKRAMESAGGVELYDRLRYMTMTGNRLTGTPETIEERGSEIAQVHTSLFPRMPLCDHSAIESKRTCLNDDELLAKARTAKNRAKFCGLYDRGDISSYASSSEADLALCAILAFWAGGDAAQIDRLFRRSALFRQEKWDAEHFADGKSYGEATIAKAVAGTREFYQPNRHYTTNEMVPGRST
jgi:putative DNA primase/helicase